MTDDTTDDQRIVTDGVADAEERREIPGGDDLHDVDPELDFSKAADTWIGEITDAQLDIESLDGTQVKQFRLVAPERLDDTLEIVRAFLREDKLAVCATVVAEPDVYARWEQLDGYEKAVLYDRCLSWVNAREFVDAGMIEELRDARVQ